MQTWVHPPPERSGEPHDYVPLPMGELAPSADRFGRRRVRRLGLGVLAILAMLVGLAVAGHPLAEPTGPSADANAVPAHRPAELARGGRAATGILSARAGRLADGSPPVHAPAGTARAPLGDGARVATMTISHIPRVVTRTVMPVAAPGDGTGGALAPVSTGHAAGRAHDRVPTVAAHTTP